MTLNIAFTSRYAVYLSGDFRLTYSRSGKTWCEDEFEAQKLVPVCKHGLCGAISFCGVAALPDGRPVGDWILESVRPDSLDCTDREIIGRLRGADSWISHVFGDRRFCIVFAGFKHRKPFIHAISNFQGVAGREWPASKSLKVESVRPKHPTLQFFGDRRRVHELLDAKETEQALALEDARTDLQYNIAVLNALVAGGGISPECVVARVLPTAALEIRPFVNRREGYMPGFVKELCTRMGLTELVPKTDADGKPLLPSWVGMTFKNKLDNGEDVYIPAIAIANVERPIGERNPNVFWKIAGYNEPRLVQIEFPDE